jgi:transcriptional regulator with XRE-family HTH domain
MAALVTWTIGDLISKLMGEVGLNQQQLAEKVGISVNTLGKIIRGDTKEPDKATLDKIAVALGRTTLELWTEVDGLNSRVPLSPQNVVQMPQQALMGDRRKSEFSLRARDFARRYDTLSGHQQLALDAVLNSFEQINDEKKKIDAK